jgi:hypothetical protein
VKEVRKERVRKCFVFLIFIISISAAWAQRRVMPKNQFKIGYIHNRPLNLGNAFMKKLNSETGLNGVSLQYLTLTTNKHKKNGIYVGLQLDYTTAKDKTEFEADITTEREPVIKPNSIRIIVNDPDPDNPDPDPPGGDPITFNRMAANESTAASEQVPDLEYCYDEFEINIEKRVHSLSLLLPIVLKADFLTFKIAPGVQVIYSEFIADATIQKSEYIAGTDELYSQERGSLLAGLPVPENIPTVPKIGYVMNFETGVNINQLISTINKKPNNCPINVEVSAGINYSNVKWDLIDIEKSNISALKNMSTPIKKIMGEVSGMINPSREYLSFNAGLSLIYTIPESKKRKKRKSGCPKF